MAKSALLNLFLAIGLAAVAGSFTGPDTLILGVPAVDLYNMIGQLFLNALTLMVVPLVAASIISGMARMGGEEDFASLGLKTFSSYILTTALAVLIGWGVAAMMQPGSGQEIAIALPEQSLQTLSEQGTFHKIEQILYKLVPSNILATAAAGQMLGLIFFSLLFGFCISHIEAGPRDALINFWKGLFQVMMRMTHMVMRALPLGVFGLVAKVIATTGFDAVRSVGLFFVTVLLALALYSFVVLPLLLRVLGVNPIAHFRAMSPALLTAFSTSSSAATLPVTLECMEKRAFLPNRICSFVIPLATSLNLAGTALYSCVATFFICQAYGVPLAVDKQILVALMALLTSFGMAGIPSASIVSIMMILNMVGVPAEGIALVLAVERLLDMCRTTTNVLSNSCCAVLVAGPEREKHVLAS